MKKLTTREKISYGFGDMGNGFMFDMGQLYLLKFYTDVAGIPAVVAGGVFLFTKLFPAIVDPIAGTFIDSRRGKPGAGKYRQIMMVSSIILAIISIFVFLTPNFSLAGKIIYAYASYMVWGVAYSFTNIPYGTLAATMTQDPQERTSLASFRQLGSTMALVGIGAFYVTFRNCREHTTVIENKIQKIDLKDVVKTVVTNRPLLILILMTIFSISAFNLRSAMLIYFCQYNLGNKTLMAYVGFVSIGCSLLGVVAIDYGEWKTGEKRGAITYSVFNFSRKIAQSIAGFAAGYGLTLIGYIPNVKQTSGTLFGIKGLLLLYPAFALGVAIIIIAVLYNLSDKRYLEIARELRERNS